jgi:L-lactate utilization protein LutC
LQEVPIIKEIKMNATKNLYWGKRLNRLKEALIKNNFAAYISENGEEAKNTVLNKIIPQIKPKTISWGGSVTLQQTGILDNLKNNNQYQIINPSEDGVPWEELLERRRNALLADLFLAGSNAVTEAGQLVNLDSTGNRVGAMIFGPKNVIILIGRNKITKNLDSAMQRIKNYTAPANIMRLGFKTPCAATSFCEECRSPARICNYWTVIEKSWSPKRIKVILINEDLGI